MKKSIVYVVMTAALLAALATAQETEAPVTPTAELGASRILAGQPNTAYIKVNLRGNPPKTERKRTPVNIALVIDKSGSMQGEKIVKAKEAAIMAINRLSPEDIVSVVTYDDDVSVVVPATRATDKEAIYAQIERIEANGSTALFAGVSKGAAELRKFAAEERANRIVLLSDGLANSGPSSPGELAELGQSLGRERISVSTIGLGLDYNEDLMARLAESGGGNHLFAENAADLARAYDMEFGDLLSVVAQNVEIIVECTDAARLVRVFGYEGVIQGNIAKITIPQVYANQDRYVVAELEVKPFPETRQVRLGEASIRLNGERSGGLFALQVEASASVEGVKSSENPKVMAAVARQIGAERMLQAQRLRDAGDIEGARSLYHSNISQLFEQGQRYGDEHLLKDAATNQAIVEKVEDDQEWKVNRKRTYEEASKAKKQGLGYKN